MRLPPLRTVKPFPTAKAVNCQRCDLAEGRFCIVDGFGPSGAPGSPDAPKLMMILEAPGRSEDLSGIPIVGPAGQIIKEALGKFGLPPKAVYVTNSVKCRPISPAGANRPPTADELDECLPWLEIELAAIQPEVVLVLGNVAKGQYQRAFAVVHSKHPEYAPRVYAEWHPAAFLHKPDKARKAKWLETIHAAARAALGLPDIEAPTAEGWKEYENDFDAIARLLATEGPLSLDIETRPGGPGELDELVSWSLGSESEGVFIDYLLAGDALRRDSERWLQRTFDWARGSHLLVGSNCIGYDYFVCQAAGIDVVGCEPSLRDTMLMSHVKREHWVGLKDLARNLEHMDMEEIKSVLGRGKSKRTFDMALADPKWRPSAVAYAIRDAVAGARVHRALDLGLAARQREYLRDIEYPLAFTLARNTRSGVLVDRANLGELGAALDGELARTADWLTSLGVDVELLHKPRDLGPHLVKLGVPLTETTEKNGILTTKEDALLKAVGVIKESELDVHLFRDYAHVDSFASTEALNGRPFAIVSGILHYRHTDKDKTTYVESIEKLLAPIPQTSEYYPAMLASGLKPGSPEWTERYGLIHPEYRQAGSERFGKDPTDMAPATGRISAANPNIQNIPKVGEIGKKMRKLFVAPPGFLWVRADMSQLELRLIAHFTGNELLRDVFERDGDPHAEVADMMSVTRAMARTGVYAVVYDAQPQKTATTLQVTLHEAQRLHQRFEQEMPELRGYRASVERFVAEHGFIETLLGRRIYVPEYFSPVQRLVNEALRQAGNGRVQGTGAEILKIIQVESEPLAWKYGGWQLFQVHDELNFVLPCASAGRFMIDLEELGEAVGRRVGLSVPLKFQPAAGENWGEVI